MTIMSELGKLESAGLIRLAQLEPELEYLFRHVLVQDAAYASLLVSLLLFALLPISRKKRILVPGVTIAAIITTLTVVPFSVAARMPGG